MGCRMKRGRSWAGIYVRGAVTGFYVILQEVQLQAKELQRLSLINCPALQRLSFPMLSTELQQGCGPRPPQKASFIVHMLRLPVSSSPLRHKVRLCVLLQGAKVLVEVQGCNSLSEQVIAALLRLRRPA